MSFIYLASPYTHPRATVRHDRYLKVRETTATLLKKEIHVYSPIVHCHDLAVAHNLPKEFDFWCKYNKAMLSEAVALWVLQIPGWEDSKGVKWEIMQAHKLNIPVKTISYPLKEVDL